jgi:diguanylate cyclase (GGDEF)-like protein
MPNNALPILDNIAGMVYRCLADENWSFDYVSRGCYSLTGYEQASFTENKKISHKSLVHPDDREMVLSSIKKAIERGASFSLRYRIIDALGLPRRVSEQGRAVISGNGQLACLEGFIAESGAVTGDSCGADAVDLYSCTILKALPDLMFVLDKDGYILQYKEAKNFSPSFGVEEFVGRNIYEVFPGRLVDQILYYAERALLTAEVQDFDFQIPVAGGPREYEARVTISGVGDILVIVRDITERKQMERRLNYMSLHDPLTGLFNRAYFEQEMKRHDGGRQSLGIIICDVDGLKLVNDTLGHEKGDALLIAAARMIKGAFRGGDMVARIGGDEFGVLLPNSDREVMKNAAGRIRAAIEKYNAAMGPDSPLSVSIGLAFSEDAANTTWLYKEADNSMHREKLHRSQSARSSIVQALMKALSERDFITEGHADRLQDIVVNVARDLGMSERKITDLRLLARFHDIGKVGIPDSILFKPCSLTMEEFNEMKRHTEIGHRIAESAADLIPIADWILKHHEWWDGGGYPLGLKGDDIPVECRILSIADAYDAMTSDRPYRSALDHGAAVREIVRCSGSQFDPELVPVFIRSISTSK